MIENDRVIAIAGLAKNTGKTTTLNALMAKFDPTSIGVSSIGLDGEAIDTITRLPKPDIVLQEGTIFATASKCLAHASGEAIIIKTTDFPSALGTIVIARVTKLGSFLIAGPTTNRELNLVIKLMRPFTKRIFIDGALDRKTFSALEDIDACILSTGASVAETMEDVIEHTVRVVKLFSLPKTKTKKHEAPMVIEDKDRIIPFERKDPTLLKAHLDILKRGATLHLRGAFTERFIDVMIRYHLIGLKVIVENPTMFILSKKALKHFDALSINAMVHHPISLRFITINPTRMHTEAFDKATFKDLLKQAVTIPVFNVKSEEVS